MVASSLHSLHTKQSFRLHTGHSQFASMVVNSGCVVRLCKFPFARLDLKREIVGNMEGKEADSRFSMLLKPIR